jgi:hypothetical protein
MIHLASEAVEDVVLALRDPQGHQRHHDGPQRPLELDCAGSLLDFPLLTRRKSHKTLRRLNVIDMEEEAIIKAAQPGPKTTISESLELEFLHVSFRVLRRFKYQDKVCRATLKNPSWLSDLQTSAPLDGYVMEHGEFSASLPKDGRITEGVKVTAEVADS